MGLADIGNKIFDKEVKLSSEEVQLGLIQRVKAKSEELNAGQDKLGVYATDAREAIAKGVKELDRLEAVKRLVEKAVAELEKKTKDLGLDVKELKDAKFALKQFEQFKKSVTKVLK